MLPAEKAYMAVIEIPRGESKVMQEQADESGRSMPDVTGTILIVDDDAEMRSLISDLLNDRGHRVTTTYNGHEALTLLGEQDFDVVLTDLRMQEMSGIELLREVKLISAVPNVVLMTAFGTVETAIEAMKQGAYDYLTKPVKSGDLFRVVERAVRDASLRKEISRLRQAVSQEYSFHKIIGKSKPMRALFDLIRRVSDSSTNLLITGESGTGKELAAKAIHYNSARRNAAFVPVNCAAIPEALLESELFGHVRGAFTDAKSDKRGLFEEAHGGTLFLDEISELPLVLQAKLLRAIQEHEIRRVGATHSTTVDVRIIAATNFKLLEEVQGKRFREDLYYRLNVIEIEIPPLRERKEDVLLLVGSFLEKYAKQNSKKIDAIHPSALALLVDYAWPGNVRELENVIERAVTLSRTESVIVEDLPPIIQDVGGNRQAMEDAVERVLSLEDVEKAYILRILEKTDGNKLQAAHLLGIDRKTLYRKLGEIADEGKA